MLTLLLQRGIPIDLSDASGRTALHLAAEDANPAAVNHLVEQGASINIQTKSGQTPLIRAIVKANKDVIHLLVNLHADISLMDNYGRTAVTWLKAPRTNDEVLKTISNDSESGETLNIHRLKQTVVDLSAELRENHRTKSITTKFNQLGHCFALLDSTERASFAFQQKTRTTVGDAGGVALHNVRCDDCSVSPIKGPHFVCQVCPDTDLCRSCMDAYVGGKGLRHCDEHTFMQVSTSKPPSHDDKTTIDDWLRRNIEMYSDAHD